MKVVNNGTIINGCWSEWAGRFVADDDPEFMVAMMEDARRGQRRRAEASKHEQAPDFEDLETKLMELTDMVQKLVENLTAIAKEVVS